MKPPFLLSRVSPSPPSLSSRNMKWIFRCFLSSTVFFYIGFCVGWNVERVADDSCGCNDGGVSRALQEFKQQSVETKPSSSGGFNASSSSMSEIKNQVKPLAAKSKSLLRMQKLREGHIQKEPQPKPVEIKPQPTPKPTKGARTHLFTNKNTGNFVSGMEFADREEFAAKFLGIPFDKSEFGNNQVVILYSDESAFPDGRESNSNIYGHDGNIPINDATKNCNNLHVVLTQEDRKKQCVAIVGQYESFHIQKFMRVPLENDGIDKESYDEASRVGPVNSSLPLRFVNRGMALSGKRTIWPPTDKQTKTHWYKNLIPYLQAIDTSGKEENSSAEDNNLLRLIKPVAQSVASHNDRNTIIVLVCNFGQSDLLMNCTYIIFYLIIEMQYV